MIHDPSVTASAASAANRDRKPSRALALRFASALVWVPFLAFVAYSGGPLYGVVVAGTTLLGAWEMRSMLRARGYEPLDPVLLGLAALLPLDAWFLVSRSGGLPLFRAEGMLLVGVVVIASLVLMLLRRQHEGAVVDWALSLAAGLYLGGLMQFYAPLRDRPDGVFWVVSTVGASMLCDSAAFFVGRRWGRTPLAPAVSPKKSVEGALGGLVVATVLAALWGAATGHAPWLLAGFGFAIGVATIAGDLVESLLKRQTGVKDSGGLVPGHGGMLDRMDSLLFSGPVAVLYLLAFA